MHVVDIGNLRGTQDPCTPPLWFERTATACLSFTSPVTWVLCLLLLSVSGAGCATTRFTDTSRSAFEQELMSMAVDAAVEPLEMDVVADSAVLLDATHLGDRTDRDYIQYVVRRSLAEQSVRLVEDREDADFIVMLGIGSSGTNRYDSLVGLPATPIGGAPLLPIAVQIPEIALYKYVKQHGVCRVRLSVVDTKTGALVSELDSGFATSERTFRWLLGVGPQEKQRIFFR
jgi:nucleotide-binding universal stress UspA family protein